MCLCVYLKPDGAGHDDRHQEQADEKRLGLDENQKLRLCDDENAIH
jgi:hypothetical protein